MADPLFLRRPPAGGRYDPNALDAKGRDVDNDFLGVEDDGSGGKKSAWKPLPGSTTGGDGAPSGTPGDALLPFVVEAGESFVLGAHGEDYEVLTAGRIRRNLRKASYLQGQADVVAAGAPTAYLDVGYSLDNGATITALLGLKVPVKAVKHSVGFALRLDTELGDVLLVPVVAGGNDTDVPEILNFIVSATAVAPPPADGEDAPDTPPPPPGPLPEDTTFGDVILDLNTRTETDFADGARMDPWTDDSPTGADGTTYTGASGAEYHAGGFLDLPLVPYAQLKPSDYYFFVPNSIGGNETTYIYGIFESGMGTGNVGGNEAAHIFGMPFGIGGENSYLRLQGDGKLYLIAGVSIFGGVEGTGTIVITDGQPHMIRLVHSTSAARAWVYVDGVLDIDTGAVANLASNWSTDIIVGGNLTGSNRSTFKLSRIVRYNKAHVITGLTLPESTIIADSTGGGGVGTDGGDATGIIGFGAGTAAGRGGTVYRVTNLNDTGPGSLRDALLASEPRNVVFEVSGTIALTSKLNINSPFVTIAGQSAPSPGILLKNYGFNINTHDVLVQHIRIRVGKPVRTGNNDGIQSVGGNAYNIVLDHCSASWATDENISTWFSGTNAGAHDITICNSILSENMGSGSLLLGDWCTRISVIGNLFAHNPDRDPFIKGGTTAYVANNLVYDFGGNEPMTVARPDSYGGGATLATLVSNYFKRGPSLSGGYSRPIHLFSSLIAGSQVYVDDNADSGVGGGSPPVDPTDLVNDDTSPSVLAASPPITVDGFTPAAVGTIETGILTYAGAWASARDAVDTRIVSEYNAGTGSVITHQDDVGGFPTIANNTRTMEDAGMPPDPTTDTDSDGITDFEDWLKALADTAAGI